jgi:hypothetical protein
MLVIDIALWLALQMTPASAPPPARVEFQRDVRPILEQRCQPCHFAGGKMYAHLPFDKAETIDNLGTKLFTRIKRENEQKVIRAYLAR